MDRDSAKDILSQYSGHDLPGDVSTSFERWLIDEEGYERKSEALRSHWDGLPDGLPTDRLPKAESVLRDARRREEGAPERRRRMKVLAFASMAAAIVFGALSGFLLYREYKVGGTVCMVSSRDGKSDFVLPDGTEVWLNRGSRLTYKANLRGRERRVSLEGEGYFDVYRDPEHPFVVDAQGMSVRVHGTRFTAFSEKERGH